MRVSYCTECATLEKPQSKLLTTIVYFSYKNYCLMDELEDSETKNLGFQGVEESLTHKDVGVFDTIIINDS